MAAETTSLPEQVSKDGRMWHLDFLRIISIAAVVFLHVAAQNWWGYDLGGFNWNVANLYDSCVRWSVPVFVMISGALFLSPRKKITIQKLYKKNIPHILIVLLFWSFVYVASNLLRDPAYYSTIAAAVKNWLFGPLHLWFLFMIIGLYIITPLLRCIVLDKTTTKYFLIISFICSCLLPLLEHFQTTAVLYELAEKFMIRLPVGYSFYFVLGFYLNTCQMTSRTRKLWYAFGILGIAATFLFTYALSYHRGDKDVLFYEFLSPTVVPTAIAIFVLAKHRFECHRIALRQQKALAGLSKATLGVYMVHMLILFQLCKVPQIDSLLEAMPMLSVPLLACSTIALSFGISWILNKIPFFNKHFV